MSVSVKFLGASGTVTGSKYLVRDGKYNILVDAGLFQGDREWSQKNWEPASFEVEKIDAVLVTHAHIDHIGMLPRYVAHGLKCPLFMTAATSSLSRILLLDSGRLQEEEANYRRHNNKSRFHPPLPLYTEAQAEEALKFRRVVPYNKEVEVLPGVKAVWGQMGHIAGASSISLKISGKLINFSGDVGRYGVPILKDPQPLDYGDLLLVESTYGDRVHGDENPLNMLAAVINRTSQRGGIVLIPSFAVGRAQTLLYYLRELKAGKQIPDIPVVIDSPMAYEASQIYSSAFEDYDDNALALLKSGHSPFHVPKIFYVRDREESIKLNSLDEPMILISASGMLSGGRILHHLKHRISDPRNTLLFVGFQPPGSRGALIKSGAASIQLFKEEIPIRAEIDEIGMLSAHADKNELLRWCQSGRGRPGKVAIVHGEPGPARLTADRLAKELSWDAFVAKYLEEIII